MNNESKCDPNLWINWSFKVLLIFELLGSGCDLEVFTSQLAYIQVLTYVYGGIDSMSSLKSSLESSEYTFDASESLSYSVGWCSTLGNSGCF